MGIDAADDEVLLSRSINIEGKNVCRINGQKVTVAMLREVAQHIADIYGQHESSKLLDQSTHLQVLDDYAKEKLSEPLNKQALLYEEYKDINAKLKKYGDMRDIDRTKDLLEYQIKEIEDANLIIGEEEELLARRKRMNNFEVLLTSLNAALEALDGEDGAISRLSYAQRELIKCSEYDQSLSELADRADSCKIELSDICDEINSAAQDCDFDPNKAQAVYDRLNLIRGLERKYGADIAQILDSLNKFKEQYDFYSGGEQAVEQLNMSLSACKNKLALNTKKLSDIRRSAAKEIENSVTKQLRQLGMKNAVFSVKFDDSQQDRILEKGSDVVEFMFSANSGQPLRSLSKIISGGELSRFMLAVKNTVADTDGIQTMIFDEIDTGISGDTAQTVAEKLYDISLDRQVLAVTHLPQLGSMADSHYLISKSVSDNNTFTRLDCLDEDGMLHEIARLIGGKDYSEYALPHAKDMKTYANTYKSQKIN